MTAEELMDGPTVTLEEYLKNQYPSIFLEYKGYINRHEVRMIPMAHIITDYEVGQKVEYYDGIGTILECTRKNVEYYEPLAKEPSYTNEYRISHPRGEFVVFSFELGLIIKREDLEVGDPVIIEMHRNFGQKMSRIFTKVTKITKTQIHVKHLPLRFRKSDGHPVGEAQFAETYFRLEGYRECEHVLLMENIQKHNYIKAIMETDLENVPNHKLRILVDTLHPKLLKDGIKNEY